MSRRLRLLFAALAMAALLWLLFAAAERFLALTQRFLTLPVALQWTLGAVLAIFAAAGLSVLWWLLRPRRKRRPLPVPDRGNLEQRIGQLREHGADTGALATELGELDRRRLGARLCPGSTFRVPAGIGRSGSAPRCSRRAAHTGFS